MVKNKCAQVPANLWLLRYIIVFTLKNDLISVDH